MATTPAGDADPFAGLIQARADVAVLSTADRVANVLREQIAEGHLRSGMQLPEQQICTALAVSRNTVREALAQLIGERVLVREAHRGVFVATPDASTVRDIYRVRRILEPGVLRQVDVARVDVTPLRAAVMEGQAAVARSDGNGVGSANQHFHRELVALAGSPRLDHQMALLLAEMRLVFHQVGPSQEFHLPYLAENDAVCSYLEAGDSTAAVDRLGDYLDRAGAALLAAIDPGGAL
ncbi:MAG: GntR family transcriptional regulator [Allobranchiibius sp.]